MTDRIEQKPSEQEMVCRGVEAPKVRCGISPDQRSVWDQHEFGRWRRTLSSFGDSSPFQIKPRSITTPPPDQETAEGRQPTERSGRPAVPQGCSRQTQARALASLGSERLGRWESDSAALKNQIKQSQPGASRPSAPNRHISWPERHGPMNNDELIMETNQTSKLD